MSWSDPEFEFMWFEGVKVFVLQSRIKIERRKYKAFVGKIFFSILIRMKIKAIDFITATSYLTK